MRKKAAARKFLQRPFHRTVGTSFMDVGDMSTSSRQYPPGKMAAQRRTRTKQFTDRWCGVRADVDIGPYQFTYDTKLGYVT